EHGQRHREVLALVERTVDLDRLFGGRHTLLAAAVGEHARGDGEIGVEPRLESEIADAGCDLETPAADRDGARRIAHRIEHAEIGAGPAHHILQADRLSHGHAALDLTYRLDTAPEPGEGDTLGVERLRNGPGSLEPDILARIARTSLRIANRLIRPLH